MFDYENYLSNKLMELKYDLSIDGNIEVANEQLFARKKKLETNTIYVVVKYLTSSLSYGVKNQPIQIMVLSEQNSMENAKMLFNMFANNFNWQVVRENTTMVKQQYNPPVVLSNFNEVSYGYRSLLYVTGFLFIMENIVDVKNLIINDTPINPLSFSFNYSMSGNTQPVGGEKIASTTKSVSTFGVNMSIPLIWDNEFVTRILLVSNGSVSGNENFYFEFEIGNVEYAFNMKLTNCQFATAPNDVPSLNLSFMR